uniref:Uncharacterized protein n=1 Tax=Octopus bimaculoides TaxID=37653 RepID=A0A0L8GY15_OCTBM
MLACAKGNTSIIKLLIETGFDVNMRDDFFGWRALHFAVNIQQLLRLTQCDNDDDDDDDDHHHHHHDVTNDDDDEDDVTNNDDADDDNVNDDDDNDDDDDGGVAMMMIMMMMAMIIGQVITMEMMMMMMIFRLNDKICRKGNCNTSSSNLDQTFNCSHCGSACWSHIDIVSHGCPCSQRRPAPS